MSEYANAEEHKDLIGKRARIKEPEDYGDFLWHKLGIIEEVFGKLFLNFDTPAVRHKDDWSPMDGVYLKVGSFKVIKSSKVKSLICSCCGAYTRGRQWHNRDTGYGLCKDCIDFCRNGTSVKLNDKEMKSTYGIDGYHYNIGIGDRNDQNNIPE